jgi:hypothetical protein
MRMRIRLEKFVNGSSFFVQIGGFGVFNGELGILEYRA